LPPAATTRWPCAPTARPGLGAPTNTPSWATAPSLTAPIRCR